MQFGGLQKTTLVDYPGRVAATVFTLGLIPHHPALQKENPLQGEKNNNRR